MKKPGSSSSKIGRSGSTGRFVIGAARFEKISAVEGIVLTKTMRDRAITVDLKDTSGATRREKIIKNYRKA